MDSVDDVSIRLVRIKANTGAAHGTMNGTVNVNDDARFCLQWPRAPISFLFWIKFEWEFISAVLSEHMTTVPK